MRKFLKVGILALALGAVLAIQALAATGWVYENSNWVYYSSSGTKVTNEWKTDSNGDYYYLDGYGNMAVNSFIDDERFVGSDGKMVTSAWRQIDGYWYYFDANGKMVTDKKRQINGIYYYFDDDGRMLTGWIQDDDDWYYGDLSDGHLYASTWKKLEPDPEMEEIDDAYSSAMDDGYYWFYFQSSAKIARADGSDQYKEYTINSERYAFDSQGRLMTGWVLLESTTPAIAGYKFYNTDESLGTYGAAHVGWLSAYPPEGAGLGDDVVWYYFNTRGVPYYGEDVSTSDSEETLNAKLRRISKDGKTYSYLFNELGNPVYGLRRVQKSDGTITSMYFGTNQECCLQTGDTSITEGDGTKATYKFDSSGYGITGVKSNKLYYMGKLQKAEDDTYAYYTVEGTTYLVNKSGSLVKNHNSKKDSDEVEYKSDSSGIRDGGYGSVSSLLEPVFEGEY